MRIQQLSACTGATIDTLRFYEKKGLITASHFRRGENGYRSYNDTAIERVEMIRRAQSAGFSLAEIAELFDLWDSERLSDDLIVAHLREKQQQIARKIAELEQIQQYLADKIQRLRG
ncbi:MAG: MerR family transcriptional regulator [Roseiflexaceae bacterium]|nr:MerR family transcriptional regulator [Roseiflexaceae bacterium]